MLQCWRRKTLSKDEMCQDHSRSILAWCSPLHRVNAQNKFRLQSLFHFTLLTSLFRPSHDHSHQSSTNNTSNLLIAEFKARTEAESEKHIVISVALQDLQGNKQLLVHCCNCCSPDGKMRNLSRSSGAKIHTTVWTVTQKYLVQVSHDHLLANHCFTLEFEAFCQEHIWNHQCLLLIRIIILIM